MKSNKIHIIYHPTSRGYSGYSREMDGLETDGKTLQELFDKIKYLIEVRVKSLFEIGKEKEAESLKHSEIVFLDE